MSSAAAGVAANENVDLALPPAIKRIKHVNIDNENYSNDPGNNDTNITRLKKNLLAQFGLNTNCDLFNALLRETGSVIAGGSMLSTVINFYVRDYDIYVPCKHIKTFMTRLKPLIYRTSLAESKGKCKITRASKYCRSFLKRNGIRKIYTISPSKNLLTDPETSMMDIMAVRNKRNILDVVTNFDLTFCQVWYDGTSIYASHPEHISTRVGYLQGEYVPLYIMGNRFLRHRVSKYTSDRYKIPDFKLPELGAWHTTISRPANKQFEVKFDYDFDSLLINNSSTKSFCIPKNDRDEDSYYTKWFYTELLYFILYGKKERFDTRNKGLFDGGNVVRNLERLISQQTCMREDDGYDSEDYEDDENLKKLVTEKFLVNNDTLSIESKVSHLKYEFLYALTKVFADDIILEDDMTVRDTLEVVEGLQPYYNWTKTYVVRNGICPLEGDELPVWDLHEHKPEDAMCESAIASYLTAHINDEDKLLPSGEINIKCYVAECTKRLTHSEIASIITDGKLLQKLRAPPKLSAKLNTGLHISLLTNSKSTTDGWGDIYHSCICPFCLAQEERSAGCLYMTHKYNPKYASPSCQPHNVIRELIQKYDTFGKRLDKQERNANPGGFHTPGKLEFCVECSRPCWNHKHFTLDGTGFEPPIMVPGPNPVPDYAACPVGRTEAIARLLAIHKVMAEQEFDNDFEQRKACALAADIAPSDPVLMARAAEIFAKTPDTRTEQNLEVFQVAPAGNANGNASGSEAEAAANAAVALNNAAAAALANANNEGKEEEGEAEGQQGGAKLKHTNKQTRRKGRQHRKALKYITIKYKTRSRRNI